MGPQKRRAASAKLPRPRAKLPKRWRRIRFALLAGTRLVGLGAWRNRPISASEGVAPLYFKQLTDEYGLDFFKKLIAQNPKFVRGTQDAGDLVRNGSYAAAFGVGGPLMLQPGHTAAFSLPRSGPWVTWAQTPAILKNAPHLAAAKLYVSWVLSHANQQNFIRTWTWSARSDVAPPDGYESIWKYRNADPRALPAFMSDRAALPARWRRTFEHRMTLEQAAPVTTYVRGANNSENRATYRSALSRRCCQCTWESMRRVSLPGLLWSNRYLVHACAHPAGRRP
ncbi:extracellular solute-binding protein [Pendulispora rubella]|uniref:extracellular solute-binding protein n=1 Tax=Pendulispora rubella TaxID=2741070 RepID=UPI00374E0B03